jgi:phosphatidylserine/phosphatidylglycerophosphate/cardiolipin synthase-like enzyme
MNEDRPARHVTVTIPLRVTVSLGEPMVNSSVNQGSPGLKTTNWGSRSDRLPRRPRAPVTLSIESAARKLFAQRVSDAVLAVRPGYLLEGGRISDTDCLVVAAQPDRIPEVRSRVPAKFAGFPVDVRPAPISEQAAAISPVFSPEAVSSVKYNGADRTGEGFSFDRIDEDMKLTLHVGPERSWTVLSEFLSGAQRDLTSSIYQFHAQHIAEAVEERLEGGADLTLVMATQTRDPDSGQVRTGDFERSRAFEKWERRFGERFERIFVPIGADGLVANSYHIKVTVRDRKAVWLSSGNWTRSSQPLISAANLNDPRRTAAAGNREWHVVVKCDKLARRLRNHILADFEQSQRLGGIPEMLTQPILVDVPIAVLEGIFAEAAPARVLEPRPIERRVKVRPLLTPDRQGEVYTKAVLELIGSARKQLLFQNQYIKMSGTKSGFLKDLVDALVSKANLQDFRIILRSENDTLIDDVSALKRRGVDIERSVRRLAHTHTKGIIVDGQRVLLGSHNWSRDGVTLNRDASLIFEDTEVAHYYAAAFELDWARAREVTLEAAATEAPVDRRPRLAVGDAPPAGFVRMTLAEYLEA